MKELIPKISALLDDLVHLRELDDNTIDKKKLERHINTLEETLEKLCE